MSNIKKKEKLEENADVVSALEYESVFDNTLDMARTLQQIDAELNMAAMCEGDYPGGYRSEDLLPALCKIMYSSQRSWMLPKYRRYNINNRMESNNESKN